MCREMFWSSVRLGQASCFKEHEEVFLLINDGIVYEDFCKK